MKKTNKKGFTIVELVIVIAVIASLAGVMIPTFGSIIDNAQESAEQQKVTSAFKEAYAEVLISDGEIKADETSSSYSGYTFKFGADAATCEITAGQATGYTYTYDGTNHTWTVEKN